MEKKIGNVNLLLADLEDPFNSKEYLFAIQYAKYDDRHSVVIGLGTRGLNIKWPEKPKNYDFRFPHLPEQYSSHKLIMFKKVFTFENCHYYWKIPNFYFGFTYVNVYSGRIIVMDIGSLQFSLKWEPEPTNLWLRRQLPELYERS